MFNSATHTKINNSNLTHVGGNQIYNTLTYNITMGHPRGIVYDSGDGTLCHLPLEQVDIDVFIVDGNVTLVDLTSCYILTLYNSLCTGISETGFFQFL